MDGLVRVTDPADPRRCQAITPHGQCSFTAVEGYHYCKLHDTRHNDEKIKLRNYRLSQWKGRVAELGSSSEVKSLRDEIGILRLLLEQRLNACADTTDLMLHSHALSKLVLDIEKLVGSCHKLESSMGQLLDKQAILNFASIVVSKITNAIQTLVTQSVIQPSVADMINEAVADALMSAMPVQPSDPSDED